MTQEELERIEAITRRALLALFEPVCPKGCDIATPPEGIGGDRWVCVGCGHVFRWRLPAKEEGRR